MIMSYNIHGTERDKKFNIFSLQSLTNEKTMYNFGLQNNNKKKNTTLKIKNIRFTLKNIFVSRHCTLFTTS